MRTSAIFLAAFLLAASGLYLFSAASQGGNYLRVSDGSEMALSDIVPDLQGSRIVFVGEQHDRKDHHRVQLDVVRAIHGTGTPVAIGFEMFESGNQPELDAWVAGRMDEKEFRQLYEESWGMPWELYRDIFLYARENNIRMLGLNIPREVTQQVAREGFGSLSKEQLAQMPKVQCRVSPEYESFIRRAFGAHGHHESSSFANFCEAQLVWDTAMASNLVDFVRRNPGHTVVVIAGNGHAWKPGIPEQVSKQADVSFRVIVPEVPGRLDPESVSTKEADYLWRG